MKKKSIVICDDNPDVGSSLKLWMRQFPQVKVDFLTTGRGLMQYLSSKEAEELPDLILIDLCLPDIEGDDIVAWVRKKASLRSIPIILMSAVIVNVEDRAHLVGANDFVVKPFEMEELHHKIENLIFSATP